MCLTVQSFRMRDSESLGVLCVFRFSGHSLPLYWHPKRGCPFSTDDVVRPYEVHSETCRVPSQKALGHWHSLCCRILRPWKLGRGSCGWVRVWIPTTLRRPARRFICGFPSGIGESPWLRHWGRPLAKNADMVLALVHPVLRDGTRMPLISQDLATHSRLLLYNRPKHTLLWRWLGLYPLYILAEVAIVATDLAELLGSAIALCMLFPKLELWHGVLITGFDVMLILAMGDPLRGRPVRLFEFLIAGLVLAVLVCMIVIISKVDVNWGDAFKGYIPSKYIFQSGGLYTSVGILGATVMPHSLFIGSALATQDRIEFRGAPKVEYFDDDSSASNASATEARPSKRQIVWRSMKKNMLMAFKRPPPSFYHHATRHSERENNPYAFVAAHLYHGIADVVASLLGFAVLINSLILMLASAVFFYGNRWDGNGDPASLFDAYDLIRDIVGKPAATLFAIALLASGQSSSLIATVAGQAVCEGFLQWRVSPIMRRLITRLLAIIPSMIVAIAMGRRGIDGLLIASQVVLSVVLPFVTFPLLWCTSSKAIMSVRKAKRTTDPTSSTASVPTLEASSSPHSRSVDKDTVTSPTLPIPSSAQFPPTPGSPSRPLLGKGAPQATASSGKIPDSPKGVEAADEDEIVDYSNNKVTIVIGAIIWLVVVAANVYVLVDLGIQAGK